MVVRKIINTSVVMLGIVALIIGVFAMVESDITEQSPWIFAIIGTVLFGWGMVLLRALDNDDSELPA